MPRFLAEPKHDHAAAPRIGILLVNLGTPEAPTAKALRPYLKQFLSDPRVIEIPRLLWTPLLNLVILNTRPRKSAEKYAKIWASEGSPLKVYTEKQAKLLQGYYVQAGFPWVHVEFAMRYGQPDITAGLMQLKARQCTRILVLPLYPQYSAAATASVFDAVGMAAARIRNLPELRFVRNFHDHPDYIAALANRVQEHWRSHGQPEVLVMSFHGVPRYTLDRGDPYFCECQKTGRLLAARLGLKPEQYRITFQSRFGRAEWLKPYTEPTLRELAKAGCKAVDVVCPGFVADCLETLEEIAMECKAAFVSSGGKHFGYIPCLNDRHDFIGALQAISRRHIEDWLALPAPSPEQQAATAQRAQALGAKK